MQHLPNSLSSVLPRGVIERRTRTGGSKPQRATQPSIDHFLYHPDYEIFSHGIWFALVRLAKERYSMFGKHGENFDRRLFAEIEAITRISFAFRRYGIVLASSDAGKALQSIERQARAAGNSLYYDFP